MKSVLRNHRGLVATFTVLLAGLALGLLLGTHHEPRVERSVQVAKGPPSCMGFSLDDPCMNRRALGQCRAAVAQCGDDPVSVIETCPLQFRCGR